MTATGFVALVLAYALTKMFGKRSLFEYNWADYISAGLLLVAIVLIPTGLAIMMWRHMP